MMRTSVIIISIIVSIVVLPEQSSAQLPPMLPDDPEQAPVDGGLGILAAAGGAYALKKLRDRQKS